MHRTLDPVALLAEMRAAQEELGTRVDRRGSKSAAPLPAPPSAPDAATFAKALGKTAEVGEPRATHRRLKRRYKTALDHRNGLRAVVFERRSPTPCSR